MSIKAIILGGMSLYAVYKHDSTSDKCAANSTVDVSTVDVSTVDVSTVDVSNMDAYDKHISSLRSFDDHENELPNLMSKLHKAEVKYNQCCTSPKSDCSECPIMLDKMREITYVYAIRAYQSAHNLSQENLTSTLHDLESRFENNCEVWLREDGREYGTPHPDSIFGYNECSKMRFAITRMQKQYKKKFN